jgi:hypothetical protein
MCGINSSNMMLYTYLDERRTVHYVLFYIMWYSSGPESSSWVKLICCLNYVNFKFLYLILSVFISLILFIVLALIGYFCLNLLFITNKCDVYFWWIFEVRLLNWDKFTWVF